ncbi:hypothetical protein ABFS82_08G200700 [Erythranthe guttata]
MSFREGRGRPRRGYPLRSEEKSQHGRGNIPPSRHLWVGNLSHSLTENALAHHFLQFGELEKIAFQPGRSYAFINYRNEEEAFIAVRELQGFVIEGNPVRIEFAKAEKSSNTPRDAEYSERREDPNPRARGSPYSQRDSRARYSSPDISHSNINSNKSRMNDKDSEPSEVLWIGFPAQLKVDEFILRKSFAPFGDIEKITAFPGRTYAFVRYRNVIAAIRAKEALHGKLFGNPRVHICFAKTDSSNRERNNPLDDDPPSPHGGPSFGRAGSFERFRSDRSPPFIPNLDRNIYDHRRAHIREYSPEKFHRQGQMYDDDLWDLPEDVSFLHGAKKLKTETYPLPENELPEYPFSDLEKSKRVIPQSVVLDKNYDPRYSGYNSRPISERLVNVPTNQQFGERGDYWNNAPQDDYKGGSGSMMMPLLRTNERRGSSSKEVWKWEGMIAKGGTTICRTRCFPVGKPPDIALPEYLDCTARTSLDMLAKHYYQAATAWVVFFVPANDHDISYYNEFMNYLGEKQRAAVVKVDERTTLFLVPPSEFSEKVLKVPGQLSISGVLLRLEPSGNIYAGPTSQNESASSFAPNYLPPPPPPPPLTTSSNNYGKPANDYIRNIPSQASNSGAYSAMPPSRPIQEATHISNYTPDFTRGNSGMFNVPESSNIPSEQLAQLASSLLGQQQGQGQFGEYRPQGNINHQSGYPVRVPPPQNYGLPNEQVSSDLSQAQQIGQLQQLQQQSLDLAAASSQANQNDDSESDPQKRLQATLQLAAALLQQIQHGKGN